MIEMSRGRVDIVAMMVNKQREELVPLVVEKVRKPRWRQLQFIDGELATKADEERRREIREMIAREKDQYKAPRIRR